MKGTDDWVVGAPNGNRGQETQRRGRDDRELRLLHRYSDALINKQQEDALYSVPHAIFTPMISGDLLNNKTRENGEFQWTGWIVGSASLLLLISAGLELFVQQTLGHNSVATVILALLLALWSYVLGLGILLVLAVWCLVAWRRVRVKRAAMSSDASAGPRSRHLEQPELREPQSLQQRVAPVVPSRSSRDSDDRRNETNNRTRVA
jgi:membrane protein implicated in regulation of membrane protease activity